MQETKSNQVNNDKSAADLLAVVFPSIEMNRLLCTKNMR